MGVTQENEILEIGPAAVAPLHDVVGLQPSEPAAAGEDAAAVSEPHRPQQPRRGDAASPSDADAAALALEAPLDPRVAGQPADRIGEESDAILGLSEQGA